MVKGFGVIGVGVWAACLHVAGLGVSIAWGQAQVLVSFEGELLPVVAMNGSQPVVEVAGSRVPAYDGKVTVVPADRYTDGAVEIVEQDAIMGQDYGSSMGGFFFRFDATVRAERDFEDCFVLFVISPEMGESSYVLREIPDINVVGRERILVTLPVNPGFGGGKFGFKLFSRGEEIRVESDGALVSIRDESRQSGSSAGRPATSVDRQERSIPGSGYGKPASAAKPRLLEFPESLVGTVAGGYAEAVYSVGKDGRVFEILELRADHPEMLPEVWETVTQTLYEPGFFDGKALVTTIRQRFFFNEFAPFSEEMVMIPYPDFNNDRRPRAIYSPPVEIDAKRAKTVEVEGIVDRLGRFRSPSVVSEASEAEREATLNELQSWLFEPAIVDGYPVDQRMLLTVNLVPRRKD